MKKLIVVALIVLFLPLTSCSIAPPVTYTEANDSGNGTDVTAETITQTTEAVVIGGSISSASDVDYYKLNIPSGCTKLYLDTYDNGTLITDPLGLGISLFPIHYTEYNAAGDSYPHLFVGAVRVSDLHVSNVSYILLQVCGTSDFSSNNYTIRFYAGN